MDIMARGRKTTGYIKRLSGPKGIYIAIWVSNGIKYRRTTGTSDEGKAREKLAEFTRPFQLENEAETLAVLTARLHAKEAAMAAHNDLLHPPLRVADAWREYVKSPSRPDTGQSTLNMYESLWERFDRWMDANMPKDRKFMRDVTLDVAQQYARDLSVNKYNPNTYNKHIRLLQLVFRVLGRQAKVKENPWKEIQRKRVTMGSRREFTTDELRAICAKAEGEMRTLFAIGLYTGARLGDASQMDWSNVNMQKLLIRYSPRKTARRSGKILTVPIHPALFSVLSEVPAKDRKGPIMPELTRRYTERGPHSVSQAVQAHLRRCGIMNEKPTNGDRTVIKVGFHSLRHTAVSLLRDAGAPLSVTMAIVGHSSLAMHDVYTHTGEAAMRTAVAALPSMMGGTVTPPQTPLPDWALEKIKGMTAESWAQTQRDLLGMQETPSPSQLLTA